LIKYTNQAFIVDNAIKAYDKNKLNAGDVLNLTNDFTAVTGRGVTPDDLVQMSEAVYNFQRVFNLRMGYGRREHDTLPYRAMGPVTVEEYESRRERYDKQLTEKHGIDINGKETLEKVAILRGFREQQYEELKDAVYERRGWNKDGIPTLETVKRLGIDFPEVLELLKANGVG
jgi:aldehyde:ferredoxin oxidoreductase